MFLKRNKRLRPSIDSLVSGILSKDACNAALPKEFRGIAEDDPTEPVHL